MRLVASLTAILFSLALLNFAAAQEAKAPANPEIKKDDDKKTADDKGKDDKGKDDKTKDDKGKDKTPKAAKPTFTYDSTFAGKLMTVAQNGELTIQYTQKVPVPRPSFQQEYLTWQQSLSSRYGQYLQEKNPSQKYNHLIEYQKLQAKPPVQYEIKDMTKDVVVKQAKTMKIRLAVPELQYDDKGNLVKLDATKLKELQGPEGYPGYPAEIAALQTNQYVHVFMVKPAAKGPKGSKEDPKKGPDISDIIGGGVKDGDNKQAPTIVDEDWNGPRVILVVIRNDLFKQ